VPRQCGLGSHLILRWSPNRTIEVHLATTKFVKNYDLVFNKGDVVTVIGTKVEFEGVETIFAREVTRGTETLTLPRQKWHANGIRRRRGLTVGFVRGAECGSACGAFRLGVFATIFQTRQFWGFTSICCRHS
jgi:hypothetical protein